MAPSPSRPVSPSILDSPPPMDECIVLDYSCLPPAGPKNIILPKVCGSEKMWCEWCEKDICRNVEYEEVIMESDVCRVFMEGTGIKYHANLKADVPSAHKDLSPKRYVQKVRFWHYERYAKHYGLPWGGGNFSILPQCFKAKIRMTFRQPAKNLSEWVKEPFLYRMTNNPATYNPIGETSKNVLGKRSLENN